VKTKFDSVPLHYTETEVRSAHYMDWRNEKDYWLYDGFAIDVRRRPLFGSLTLMPWVPEPNVVYGSHELILDHPRLAGRCIYTVGDYHQPRRSMLLVLDNLLYDRKRKDDTVGQDAAKRQVILDRVLRNYECTFAMEHDETGQWTLQDRWDRALAGQQSKMPGNGEEIIECQIFGPVALAADALALVTSFDNDAAGPLFGHSTHRVLADIPQVRLDLAALYPRLALLPYEPLRYAPGPSRSSKHPVPAPDRVALLDEEAKDHVG
jgi:hypothetical protein